MDVWPERYRIYEDHSFNLEKELNLLRISGLPNENQRKSLMASLGRGNIQSAILESGERIFLKADPWAKKIEVYDLRFNKKLPTRVDHQYGIIVHCHIKGYGKAVTALQGPPQTTFQALHSRYSGQAILPGMEVMPARKLLVGLALEGPGIWNTLHFHGIPGHTLSREQRESGTLTDRVGPVSPPISRSAWPAYPVRVWSKRSEAILTLFS